MTTTHQIGIKELLQLADFKGYDPQVTLIGMAPNDISPGLELSPLVKKKLPRMTDTIKDELKKIGITIKERITDA
jgi:hydrogenase maturation protease